MIDKPVSTYGLDAPPDAYVAENFQLCELTRSEVADRNAIDNRIRDLAVLHNAIRTARWILQPLRETFGPFTPNSVYRCQELERALKQKPASWVSTSQHTRGEAADIEIIGVRNIDLAYWVRANLEFDQLILECHNPEAGPHSGWVHVSRRNGNNRNEVLSYILNGGRYRYVNGIVADAEAHA